MKTGRLCLLIAALVASPCIVAEAQDPKTSKDITGTILDVTSWQYLAPHEIVVNYVDMKDIEVWWSQQRIRNNGTHVQQRIRFDGRDGWLWVEHTITGLYSFTTTLHFQNPETARERAVKYWRRAAEPFDYEDSQRVYAYGDRAGWVHRTRGRMTAKGCIIGEMGFLSESNAGLAASRSEEHYDTSLNIRDCSGKRSFEDVVTWLKGVKIVEPLYNRAR